MTTIDMVNSLKIGVRRLINGFVRREKVAMLHPGRCGSTVLGTLMNQNQDMFWSGEPFERLMKKGRSLSRHQVAEVIKNSEGSKLSKIYCFATKYPKDMHLSSDCINMPIKEYVDLLGKLGYAKFIVIDRSNYLKRAISMELGRKTKVWHTKTESTEARRIVLDPHKFEVGLDVFVPLREYFESLDHEVEELKELLKDKQVLTINYERDVEQDPFLAYGKVCGFLACRPGQAVVELKKTNPHTVKESIINYEEIVLALRNTKYEWMLEE